MEVAMCPYLLSGGLTPIIASSQQKTNDSSSFPPFMRIIEAYSLNNLTGSIKPPQFMISTISNSFFPFNSVYPSNNASITGMIQSSSTYTLLPIDKKHSLPLPPALLHRLLPPHQLWQHRRLQTQRLPPLRLDRTGPPLYDPLPHHLIPLQVTLQTDKVTDIPCGTSSDVILRFEKIEVFNRLKKELANQAIKNYTITYDQTWIFSKIHHEINQFCSSHSLPKLLIDKFNELNDNLIVACRVDATSVRRASKLPPELSSHRREGQQAKVPEAIAEAFEQQEVQRTKLRIKQEGLKLKKKQQQTLKRLQEIDATESIIQGIKVKMNLIAQNNSRQIQAVQHQINPYRAASNAEGGSLYAFQIVRRS